VSDLDANLRSGPQMLMYRALARDLVRRKPGRVLDWGCGWGQMTALLREAGVDAVAFDYRAGHEETTNEPHERVPVASPSRAQSLEDQGLTPVPEQYLP
jgi:cyclopropane fatty-acyl-phospholipid synthase-like methyltransferase